MVKVVGGGFTVTCGHCNSELEFTRSDVRAGARIPYSDDDNHYSVIVCPKKRCGRSVDVTAIVGSASAETASKQARDDDMGYY